jgi:hypothetical protein
MKLVRSIGFLVVLISLSLGGAPVLRSTEGAAQLPMPHPCQEPDGFNEPVDIHAATASTEPRLLSDRDILTLDPATPRPEVNIGIEWAWFGWGDNSANDNEVLYSGLWAIPRTGALTFDGGRGAFITVEAGDVVLLVCGADGEIDTIEGDNQTTQLAEGSSTPVQAGTGFFVFLDSGPATYWLFGHRQGVPPESVVTVQIVGNNGGPRVCGMAGCWPAPVLPPKPNGADCDGNTCTVPGAPGGCGGIRCWVP